MNEKMNRDIWINIEVTERVLKYLVTVNGDFKTDELFIFRLDKTLREVKCITVNCS